MVLLPLFYWKQRCHFKTIDEIVRPLISLHKWSPNLLVSLQNGTPFWLARWGTRYYDVLCMHPFALAIVWPGSKSACDVGGREGLNHLNRFVLGCTRKKSLRCWGEAQFRCLSWAEMDSSVSAMLVGCWWCVPICRKKSEPVDVVPGEMISKDLISQIDSRQTFLTLPKTVWIARPGWPGRWGARIWWESQEFANRIKQAIWIRCCLQEQLGDTAWAPGTGCRSNGASCKPMGMAMQWRPWHETSRSMAVSIGLARIEAKNLQPTPEPKKSVQKEGNCWRSSDQHFKTW